MTSGPAAARVFVTARAACSGLIEGANEMSPPFTSMNERPVAPWSRLSYATSGRSRLIDPSVARLEAMINKDPSKRARKIETTGTAASAQNRRTAPIT